MKFGKVTNPENIDFQLPNDNVHVKELLEKYNDIHKKPNIHIGCAKWNKQDLKGFYPKGTKDELAYYSTQFNSIELNAFFYRIFPPEQVEKWKDKTAENFKFFPKVPQSISQFKRLKNVSLELDSYIHSISKFEEKLGMCFLQMHPTFKYKSFDNLIEFIKIWPKYIPLAVELRDHEWYQDPHISNELFDLLEKNGIATVITDTAGRRDLIHMNLTTPQCFIRFTGANHSTDYQRLDDWFERIKLWINLGIQDIYFFVHQNMEIESPLLSAYLIKRLNNELGFNIKIPDVAMNENDQQLGLSF